MHVRTSASSHIASIGTSLRLFHHGLQCLGAPCLSLPPRAPSAPQVAVRRACRRGGGRAPPGHRPGPGAHGRRAPLAAAAHRRRGLLPWARGARDRGTLRVGGQRGDDGGRGARGLEGGGGEAAERWSGAYHAAGMSYGGGLESGRLSGQELYVYSIK